MKRTPTQNRSLHKYYEMVADALNDAGLDMKKVLKPEVDIPWNKDMVKEHIWRPVMDVMIQEKSTTDMDKRDIDEIYSVIDRHLSEKHGIHVPFPSEENQ